MSTKLPVQLLDPTASTAGQVPVSTGPTSAPAWGSPSISGVLPIVNGGTGATAAAAARTNLGLGNVDNTSDANKPISNATQSSFDLVDLLKANNISPALTTPVITGGTSNGMVIGNSTQAAGAFTTLIATGLIMPSSPVGIKGTVTNDNAQAGSVGEYVTGTTAATPLTTGAAFSAASISLTAGDWDVDGYITYTPAAGTSPLSAYCSISTVAATLNINVGRCNALNIAFTIGNPIRIGGPVSRISISATTTLYVVGQSAFTGSTMTADGLIRARRIR